MFLAHQIAWLMRHGGLPKGKDILHLCHNPACSNPDHLAIGTRKENFATSRVVGRLQRKIPFTDIPALAARRAKGETWKSLVVAYGCSLQAVRHMVTRYA